jgi:hypothetical protein
MPDDESEDGSLVVEFELAEILWPVADDDLLAEDPDWWFVACLDHPSVMKWSAASQMDDTKSLLALLFIQSPGCLFRAVPTCSAATG